MKMIYSLNCAKIWDNSETLCLDFLLPNYWPKFWPPSTLNRWFLEIENHSVSEKNRFFPSINVKVEQFSLMSFYDLMEHHIPLSNFTIPPGLKNWEIGPTHS